MISNHEVPRELSSPLSSSEGGPESVPHHAASLLVQFVELHLQSVEPLTELGLQEALDPHRLSTLRLQLRGSD